MLQSDGSDYPDFWVGEDFQEQDGLEDLSISVDTFYAILNENSDTSHPLTHSHSPNSADDLLDKVPFQDPLNAVAQNLEEASQPQDGLQQSGGAFPLETGVPESSLLSLSNHLEVSDSLKKTCLEFSHESPGSFDGFGALYSASLLDSAKMDTSLQQIDSKFPVMSGPSPASDWLTLSTSGSLDPVGDSIDALLSKGTDDQYLQNEGSNSSIPSNFMEEDMSPFPDHMEWVDLTLSDSEEFGQTEVRSLLQKEVKESSRDGSADFSHLKFIKNSGLNFEENCSSIDAAIKVKLEPQKGTLDISQVNQPIIDTNFFSQAASYAKLSSQHDESTFSHMDSDPDMYILEDISDHRYPSLPLAPMKSLNTSQFDKFSAPLPRVGIERLRVSDERLTYRVALQDLSQARSEVSPPDGVLSVPLLRHQRIALSWMIQKETASLHCSGGILADDQGLGKTVSTISLILVEKSPSSKASPVAMEHVKAEALNLDEDEDVVSEPIGMKQAGNSGNLMLDGRALKSDNTITMGKGRPAAGTLVVCPTSVLRQWAEELQNKVTEKAKLSVLVYHGSNRTKDPLELAKYDVVVTTYSIVSMEVPKQPLVDQDDDEKKKPEDHGLPAESSSSRKRKHPTNTNKNKMKDRKGKDGTLLESGARPLARVGWFRVVLDEAQTIKNHRTQVARACWGLRAKRRWCLSGTPIQNAIDDLYSYFRFLRYDPYAGYKSFCSMIKLPINRSPTNGYKKLQAVLKTIMLRRTKGTLLDGEPVINLPPKSVSLKKVDFSTEERAFYSKLEADSRAQFKVYAAAGTVKQNYVNILLMLLRLRQACDHPLLVKKCTSNTDWSSSAEMAKKLPREKQIVLLNCLEACMAICDICNDPPEDAVVTICGHVFCNQCICELLTGDDNECPAARCKVQLNPTSIFSKASLRSALSDQPDHAYLSDNSGSGLAGTPDHCSENLSSDSSKIRAALEILKSLSKPQQSMLKSNYEKCCDEVSDGCIHLHDKTDWNKEKSSNLPVLHAAEKAIVFSQWTSMLDLLEVPLKNSSIQYRRLDGTMSVMARDKAVKDFNTLPEVTVMIMSLKAASLGLNMVAACHVLLLDLWWNPTTEDQAIDRAHRIGQTRPVTVSRLTVKDTVEDRILALQEKKREMVASAFGEDEKGRHQTRLTVDDLKYLFMA